LTTDPAYNSAFYFPFLIITSASIQVRYIGNTTFKHGDDYGEAPTVTIVFGGREQITSIFGRADRSINSIGITTSTGKIYGPWGGPEGDAFSIPGPVSLR
jgi:hypothetical protein